MDEAQVLDQMTAAGLDVPPLPLQIGTARRVYFGRKKKQWYRLRELRLRNGQFVIVGSFGDFKHGVTERVRIDWRGISEAERAALRAQRAAQAERERAEREREAELAALSAADLWRRAAPSGRSPYLERKAVEPEACRYLPDGSIVIPLLRYDLPREQALRAVQRIYPGPRGRDRDGEDLPQKVFTRGFEKPGCCLRLGLVVVGEPILVCEGYATGLSIRLALGRRVPVFVALDAGNLQPVCEILRRLHPGSPIVICADDDWRTRDQKGQPYNPGRDKAWRTAGAVSNTHMVYPVFGPGRQDKDTDFNDLHLREGLHKVRRQLAQVLAWFGVERIPETQLNAA